MFRTGTYRLLRTLSKDRWRPHRAESRVSRMADYRTVVPISG